MSLSRILAPNKEVAVVRALQDFGVNSVNRHLSWASQEEYWTHNVSDRVGCVPGFL